MWILPNHRPLTLITWWRWRRWRGQAPLWTVSTQCRGPGIPWTTVSVWRKSPSRRVETTLVFNVSLPQKNVSGWMTVAVRWWEDPPGHPPDHALGTTTRNRQGKVRHWMTPGKVQTQEKKVRYFCIYVPNLNTNHCFLSAMCLLHRN